jgi:DNA repair protein RecO (recombination protein O)
LITLDRTGEPVSGFHIHFSLELMHHLGIFPQLNHSSGAPYFNLREGMFVSTLPIHPDYLDEVESERLYMFITARDRVMEEVYSSARVRRVMLEIILHYYRLHLPGFGELRSPDVLHKVLG